MAELLTDDALRARGAQILDEKLGPVEALRFLALVSREPFDYQAWKERRFGAMGLEEILAKVPAVEPDPWDRW